MLTRSEMDTTPISINSPRRGRGGGVHPPPFTIHSPGLVLHRRSPPGGAAPDNFNPLSPHGERLSVMAHTSTAKQFQSTLPAWGETFRICAPAMYCSRFQSTLPAWGETIDQQSPVSRVEFQSTLPAWGETVPRLGSRGGGAISIHSPRMGRDEMAAAFKAKCLEFQSTLPAWGETQGFAGRADARLISIHSPRMGRDAQRPAEQVRPKISIHSPRMGRDNGKVRLGAVQINFNPLSPHGERRAL